MKIDKEFRRFKNKKQPIKKGGGNMPVVYFCPHCLEPLDLKPLFHDYAMGIIGEDYDWQSEKNTDTAIKLQLLNKEKAEQRKRI
jgi:hypothetical protein